MLTHEMTHAGRGVSRLGKLRGPLKRSQSVRVVSASENARYSRNFASQESHLAARAIQRAFLRHLFAAGAVSRVRVVSRLTVELGIRHSLLTFIITLVLFLLISVLLVVDQAPVAKMDLKKALERTFKLDALDDIRTVNEFRDYLKVFSAASRVLQPASSLYFMERESQALLLPPAETAEDIRPPSQPSCVRTGAAICRRFRIIPSGHHGSSCQHTCQHVHHTLGLGPAH